MNPEQGRLARGTLVSTTEAEDAARAIPFRAGALGRRCLAPILGSVQIRRSPQDVFDYVADPMQRPHWQDAVERIEVERTTPAGVGTRVRETRRVQRRTMTATWEVTEYEPAARFGFRGVDGPLRPVVTMTLTPLDAGTRTHVAIEVDFQAFGFGKLFGVLARRGARKEVPKDAEHLRERLEGPPL